MLAQTLAPVLYVQRDEWFPLERVVAVIHPVRPVIAYHMLWKDDVNGSWIPFTVPTDEEVIWVGYDATWAPTDLWTYWHGTLLHTPWRDRGQVAINVQWGKHGSLPHGVIESDLPSPKKLNDFRDFSRQLPLSGRLDAVVRSEDAREALGAVFGRPYSRKTPWPSREAPDSGSQSRRRAP